MSLEDDNLVHVILKFLHFAQKKNPHKWEYHWCIAFSLQVKKKECQDVNLRGIILTYDSRINWCGSKSCLLFCLLLGISIDDSESNKSGACTCILIFFSLYIWIIYVLFMSQEFEWLNESINEYLFIKKSYWRLMMVHVSLDKFLFTYLYLVLLLLVVFSYFSLFMWFAEQIHYQEDVLSHEVTCRCFSSSFILPEKFGGST